jgi:hypothetical protein
MKRPLAIGLLLLLTLLLSLRALRKKHGSLLRNRIFAGDVLRGEFPYHPQAEDPRPVHAPYPPSYGIVMAPLLLPPLPIARVLWVLLQISMLGIMLQQLGRWYRRSHQGRAPPPWLPILATLLVSRYLLRDTAGGGGNLIFATLVLLACLPLENTPRGTSLRGCLLGLVLAAKPTPILFLPLLLLQGRRRAFFAAILTAGLLHFSPILSLGFDGWARAYSHWIEGVLAYGSRADVFAPPSHGFPPFTWMHQSLPFMLARFLGTVPQEHILPSPLFFQGAGLAPSLIHWIYRIIALLLVWFSARRIHQETLSGRQQKLLWLPAVSALFALTLLLSPITWKSHHVALLPAFYFLLSQAQNQKSKGLWIGLLLYFLVNDLLSQEVLGKLGKNLMQSYYSVTLGALWVLAASLLLPRQSPY